MQDQHQRAIDAEEGLLRDTLAALGDIVQADTAREAALVARGRELTAQRTTVRGDKLQLEVLDQALDETERELTAHRRANTARAIDRDTPYFAHLRLVEGGRARDVLIGKGSVVDRRLPASIVDWRDAPISRLYYEYEEGEEFCEEIGDREREGEIAVRRRLDIRAGALQEIGLPDLRLRRRAEGWVAQAATDATPERDAREDHRLPDIVSLITPAQFKILTRPEAGVVLLRGQAGSGKTTVALHRIAYLHFRDPARYDPRRALVVMYNKALQTYVSKSLDDLGLRGVRVETFHAWAAGHLRAAGLGQRFYGGTPPAVAALKRHPAMEDLLRAHVERLGASSEGWFEPPDALRQAWRDTPGQGLARLHAFWARHPLPSDAAERRDRLVRRLGDHLRDLDQLFDDEALCRDHLPAELHTALPAARAHREARRQQGALDFEDAALLLRLGQLKSAALPGLACPWRGQFTHVVIDEAQDLSLVEVAVLIQAADAGRSVTIAGDPAQTLYRSDPVDFEALLARLTGGGATRLDTLPVGHRSSAPILELALRALDRTDPALIERTRPGSAVRWLEGPAATPDHLADAIRAFRARRPTSLVAVLCKQKADADAWFKLLSERIGEARRAERAGFTFEPGVVVTNVHQVKGLEFDGVVVVDPHSFGEADRRLLHVAITRAADQLWVLATRGRGMLA